MPSATDTSTTEARNDFLLRAMDQAFDMDAEDAEAIAAVVMEHFGNEAEVNDDNLTTQVRSLFYTLESKRILTFRRFEYRDEEGRILRGFQWALNHQFQMETAPIAEVQIDNIYETLPANAWARQQTA